jgi:hypothetical protein
MLYLNFIKLLEAANLLAVRFCRFHLILQYTLYLYSLFQNMFLGRFIVMVIHHQSFIKVIPQIMS